MINTTKKILLNTRLLAILLLGFASGLPLALTGSTLQAWFTKSNIDLMQIGSISLIGLPYTLKFLWAPLMDHYSLRWLGKRKSWILLSQFGLVLALVLLANLNPSRDAFIMWIIAFVIAFFSASQDIAITAYQTDVLAPSERGLGAASYIFTYRIALLVSGGFALVMAEFLGWKLTYELMALSMLIAMLLTLKIPRVYDTDISTPYLFTTMREAFTDLMTREKILLLLVFIMFYKFGDALALSLMTNFLLNGLGFPLAEVGLVYKVVSFIATVSGAFVGGLFLTRWNIYRALLVFGLAQTFSNLMFVALAIVGKNFYLMAASIFIENFCSGLSTAALLAFLMSLCNHRYSATQFAVLSAVASLGRVFLGPVASLMVIYLGWVQFYVWSFLLCFPSLFLLILLRNRVYQYVPQPE